MGTVKIIAKQTQSRHAEMDRMGWIKSVWTDSRHGIPRKTDESHAKMNA